MGRFAKPQVVRLPLSDGDWIDVKRRLNTGESQEMFSRMSPSVSPGKDLTFDSRVALTAKVLAYLVGWSFIDEGVPVLMSPEMPAEKRLQVINALYPEDFQEVREAIDAHEEAILKEVEAEKNAKAGAIASPATLQSAAG